MKEASLWMYILDENNNVVATKDYDLLNQFNMSGRRIVRQNEIRDKLVSTVFLSVDHDFNFDDRLIRFNEDKPNPKPVVFETMIKCREKGWLDYQVRYRTYKEALAGHREAMRMVIKEMRENEKKFNSKIAELLKR